MLELSGIDVWTVLVTLVLLTAAVGLKFADTAAAARLLAPAVGRIAGVLFNCRLTFGIITATVGSQNGPLDRELFSAMLLVVLLSTARPMALLRDLPAELSR